MVFAQKLAQTLGGDVRLKNSQENRGSTFVVTIDPGKPTAPVGTVEIEEQLAHLKFSDFDGSKILSVEDNADIRLIINSLLENARCEVDFSCDGEDGFIKATEKNYDLVLMDIQLPKMSGIEVTKKLRAAGYKAPIVAVTAHVLKSEHDRYLQSGFNDCLSKPFSTQSLLKVFHLNIKRI